MEAQAAAQGCLARNIRVEGKALAQHPAGLWLGETATACFTGKWFWICWVLSLFLLAGLL